VTKVRGPADELIAHFLITVMSILAIAGVGCLVQLIHLDGKTIPLMGISLGEWFFDLDVVAATFINAAGIFKAVKVAWK
jgi:hypothetical protein